MANPEFPAASAAKNGGTASSEAARSTLDAAARQAREGALASEAVTEKTAEAVKEKTAEAGRAAAKANSEIIHTQIETAQQAVRSSLEAGVRSFEGLTQSWTRALGAAQPNPDLAEQSAQNVQAVSQASSALAKGVQDATKAWFDLTQKSVRSNLDAFNQLAGCRSVQEVVNLQSNLLRNNLQQAIESGDAITRASSDAIREATRLLQPQQPAA